MSCDGRRDHDLLERKTLPSKSALDDVNEKTPLSSGSMWRCDTFCVQRDPVDATTPLFDWQIPPRF
ncbi:MAG: hypothetical protein Q9191_005769 [Dirinaria sp. TL-2023a]